jgi:voltage-gated sodium channel
MFKKVFLNDVFLLIIISFNALIIFLQGFFSVSSSTGQMLEMTDHIFTTLFIVEAIVKIQSFGVKGYFKYTWNVFDFSLVLIALPSLVVLFTPLEMVSLDFLLTLRILRVFKFFRVLKFIPNIENLLSGLLRAIQSSVLIIFAFIIFNFIFAILSFSFFSEVAPEHFSNPMISFYSTFKIFTVEGWYEIPDLIAERSDSLGLAVFARIYFVLLLFGGGIFGLSLINSIFVESMMSDNNDEVIDKLNKLEIKIDSLTKEKQNENI